MVHPYCELVTQELRGGIGKEFQNRLPTSSLGTVNSGIEERKGEGRDHCR